jgi:hypothetical protein
MEHEASAVFLASAEAHHLRSFGISALSRSLSSGNTDMRVERFRGPRLKVERANRHIEELKTLCSVLFQRNPYTIFTEENKDTGEQIFRVHINEDVPCDWGTIVGDIVHNLRAALDQLICDLVDANDSRVTKTNALLVTGSRETFETHFPKKIEGISRRAERLIRRFKPYHRGYGDKFGCSLLYLLDWLDDRDKHQGIIAVGAAGPRMRVRVQVRPDQMTLQPDGRINITMPPMGTPKITLPLTDNVEVFRIAKSDFQHESEFFFTVAVLDAPVFQGQPIVDLLAETAKLIEKGINILERYAV